MSAIRWILVVAFLAILVVPTGWTLASGQQFVRVDGESMTPTYQVGDIIVISEPAASDFREGTVVTVRNDAGELYTHRIVSVNGDQAQLKGDGNEFEDPSTITADDLVGVVRAHLGGFVGQAFVLMTTWPARISLLVLILGLMFAPLAPSDEEKTSDDESPDGRDLSAPMALPAGDQTPAGQWVEEQSLREQFFASFHQPEITAAAGQDPQPEAAAAGGGATGSESSASPENAPGPPHGRRAARLASGASDTHGGYSAPEN